MGLEDVLLRQINLTLQIEKMTVEEKLQAMEALWSDFNDKSLVAVILR